MRTKRKSLVLDGLPHTRTFDSRHISQLHSHGTLPRQDCCTTVPIVAVTGCVFNVAMDSCKTNENAPDSVKSWGIFVKALPLAALCFRRYIRRSYRAGGCLTSRACTGFQQTVKSRRAATNKRRRYCTNRHYSRNPSVSNECCGTSTGGNFSCSFAPICTNNFKCESIVSVQIPKVERTSRICFSELYSSMRVESCWGLATRISIRWLSRRLTLTITSIQAYSGPRSSTL